MLDDIDLQILFRLQKNASQPQKVLAGSLRLSESALSKRITNLTKAGIIERYTIDVNYGDLGFDIAALSLLKEKDLLGTDTTISFLSQIPEATVVFKLTGEWDFAIIWRCSSSDHLDQAVSKVTNHSNIEKIETFFVMRTIRRQTSLEALHQAASKAAAAKS